MYEKIVLAKYASLEFQLIIETNNIGDIDQCPGSANCALPSAHMTHAAFSWSESLAHQDFVFCRKYPKQAFCSIFTLPQCYLARYWFH